METAKTTTQKSKKDKRVILQAAAILYILMLLAIVLSGAVLLTATLKQYGDEFLEAKKEDMEVAKRSFSQFQASESLYDYWSEHLGELEIIPDDSAETETMLEEQISGVWDIAERFGIDENVYLKAMIRVTDAQFQSLTPEEQRLFASAAYNILNLSLGDMIMDLRGIAAAYLSEDHLIPGESLVLFANSSIPGIPERGARLPYDPKKQVQKDELYSMPDSPGKTLAGFSEDGKFCIYCYVPIVINGEVRGIYTFVSEVHEVLTNTLRKIGLACIIIFTGMLISGTLTLIFLSRKILHPMTEIQKEMRDYIGVWDSDALIGKLNEKRPDNELGQLSDDLVLTVEKLDQHVAELLRVTAEKNHLEGELDMAANLKAHLMPSIFPPFPDEPSIDLYADQLTAVGVGGDIFDFFRIDEGHIAIVAAEIFAGGKAAALYAIIFKLLINSVAKMGLAVTDTMRILNDHLYSDNEDDVCLSVWYGKYEIATGEMEAVNAGYLVPVLISGETADLLSDNISNFPMGVIPQMSFRSHSFVLKPGEKLFLYSEGVTEMICEKGKPYGLDRLLSVLKKQKGRSAEETVGEAQQEMLDYYGTTLSLDATMVCFGRKGQEG